MKIVSSVYIMFGVESLMLTKGLPLSLSLTLSTLKTPFAPFTASNFRCGHVILDTSI